MSDSPILDFSSLINSDKLRDAIAVNKVCLFIGAGVARNLGMPTWEGLTSQITDFCSKKQIFEHSFVHTLEAFNDPLKVISYCVQEIEKTENHVDFEKFLHEIFVIRPKENFENLDLDNNATVYKDLIEIYKSPKALIVQTNYDNIIEEKSQYVGKQSYVPFIDPGDTKLKNDLLVYLHGRLKDKEDCAPFEYQNLVLTRSQYNDTYVLRNKNEKFEKQENFFKKLLAGYHIIFLGYSLQDNEIVQFIANKGLTESHLEISVIIDQCKANSHLNQINANYLVEASNGNVKTYYYSTEDGGIGKNFANVISSLKNTILSERQAPDIIKYLDPNEVDFS